MTVGECGRIREKLCHLPKLVEEGRCGERDLQLVEATILVKLDSHVRRLGKQKAAARTHEESAYAGATEPMDAIVVN